MEPKNGANVLSTTATRRQCPQTLSANSDSALSRRDKATGRIRSANNHSCYVVVSSYTHLSDLAHQPKGTPAKHSLRVFIFSMETGVFTLVFVLIDPVVKNIAFLRKHPVRSVLYGVSESIEEDGMIFAFLICDVTGHLRRISGMSTGGKSPCYITLSYDLRQLFVVNYWDSTIKIIDLDDEGRFLPSDRLPIIVPGQNAGVKAKKHGDDPHGGHRGRETHAHALLLDPVFGRVAYVPDLGDDKLKQFVFNPASGELHFAGEIELSRGINETSHFPDSPSHSQGSAVGERHMIGPRYMQFHQHFNTAYVVNELASSVTVFIFDEEKAQRLLPLEAQNNKSGGEQTLRRIQDISTIPQAFPKQLNTCGRMTTDPSGKFVLVSNRGHDSIAVFPIVQHSSKGFIGMLEAPLWYHIGGHTPRHFKFAPCGRWIFVSNQDSDELAVFTFDPQTGRMSYQYRHRVPSPNFAQAFMIGHDRRQDPWIYANL
eukprot:GEMP01019975.1.p1 GENE.GEMP01019975.1~~GEMP01019975.1.p1  ORF type:complete len:485 (+),score=82.96 GEMP01019975.1:127-1581(+)